MTQNETLISANSSSSCLQSKQQSASSNHNSPTGSSQNTKAFCIDSILKGQGVSGNEPLDLPHTFRAVANPKEPQYYNASLFADYYQRHYQQSGSGLLGDPVASLSGHVGTSEQQIQTAGMNHGASIRQIQSYLAQQQEEQQERHRQLLSSAMARAGIWEARTVSAIGQALALAASSQPARQATSSGDQQQHQQQQQQSQAQGGQLHCSPIESQRICGQPNQTGSSASSSSASSSGSTRRSSGELQSSQQQPALGLAGPESSSFTPAAAAAAAALAGALPLDWLAKASLLYSGNPHPAHPTHPAHPAHPAHPQHPQQQLHASRHHPQSEFFAAAAAAAAAAASAAQQQQEQHLTHHHHHHQQHQHHQQRHQQHQQHHHHHQMSMPFAHDDPSSSAAAAFEASKAQAVGQLGQPRPSSPGFVQPIRHHVVMSPNTIASAAIAGESRSSLVLGASSQD